MATDTIPGKISARIILLLLAATLLMGLGRLLVLPAFEGYDENAHYSRIQAEAFAGTGARSYYMSTEVSDYPRHGPMSPRWIYARAFNQAYREALKTGQPLRVLEKLKTIDSAGDYTDYHDFFSTKGRADGYKKLFREQPGKPVYEAGTGVNWQYQHPPLYYVLMGRVLKAASDEPLVSRLAVLRILSYLLAFAGFALGLFATAKHLEIRQHPAARTVAMLSAFYPFVMPMYFEEFARIGNDSLCALLFSITWALMLWHVRKPRETIVWVLLGLCIGISCLVKMLMVATGFGFILFMALYALRKDSEATSFAGRFLPVIVTAAISLALGLWAQTTTAAVGSIELGAWLQGRGFVKGEGLAWTNMLWNVQNLFTSMVYNFSDLGFFHAGGAVVAGFFVALLCILGAWLAALPRDLRREEWLPFFVLLPVAGGLLLHAVLGGFAYRPEDVGVTPGRYIHVAAPALMLVFGMGMWRPSLHPRGKLFSGMVLFGALLLNLGITALRIALYTGCVWTSENFTKVQAAIGQEACRPEVITDRLSLLAYPASGFDCLALAFAALAAATVMALRQRTA